MPTTPSIMPSKIRIQRNRELPPDHLSFRFLQICVAEYAKHPNKLLKQHSEEQRADAASSQFRVFTLLEAESTKHQPHRSLEQNWERERERESCSSSIISVLWFCTSLQQEVGSTQQTKPKQRWRRRRRRRRKSNRKKMLKRGKV